mgnify:FL=1
MARPEPGRLIVIPTPIGNLEDMTYRAVRVLQELDALACEDTRHTRRIFERYGIERPQILYSCHGHNEKGSVRRTLSLLNDGYDVGLCSDAGMPGLADPGQLVIQEALEAGYEVDVLPGPSAVPTALLAAGVKAAQFAFLGFLPQRRARRRRALELYLESDTALVIFESPRRVGKLMAEAAEIFGERRGAVCLELTKKFQRVERGILAELANEFAEADPRGEAVIVIGGANTAPAPERDLGRLA